MKQTQMEAVTERHLFTWWQFETAYQLVLQSQHTAVTYQEYYILHMKSSLIFLIFILMSFFRLV